MGTLLLTIGAIEIFLVRRLWNQQLWVSMLHFAFGYSELKASHNLLSWRVRRRQD
jgi:hypothetical protein